MRSFSSLRATFCAAALIMSTGSVGAADGIKATERFVAIDDACGWPRLIAFPNGELSCLAWPNPTHGFTEGNVQAWRSRDGGRSWQLDGSPVLYAPATNRMNHAGGLSVDGTYLAIVGGWDRRLPAGWKPATREDQASIHSHYVGAKTLDPVVAVSADHGATWKRFAPIAPPADSTRGGWVPYGAIAPITGTTLGVFLYQDDVTFFVSADQGVSWRARGRLSSGRAHNETTWIRLTNGDLLAAARTTADQHVDAFRSTDGGVTWKSEGPLTLPMQHPADLTVLHDGRILLTYGVRNDGAWGIHVRFADPEAKSWSAPARLVDLEGSTDEPAVAAPRRDGGYPSTVQLADHTLVTAYYSRGVPAHQRYHVGVVRWQAPTPSSPSP